MNPSMQARAIYKFIKIGNNAIPIYRIKNIFFRILLQGFFGNSVQKIKKVWLCICGFFGQSFESRAVVKNQLQHCCFRW